MIGFKDAWMRFYPASKPIGHHIKHGSGINCTRFHVLPNSAAVARNHAEIVEMLYRYDALAKALLGDNQPCWMIVPEWQDPTGHPEHVEPVREDDVFDLESEDPEGFAGLEKQNQIWKLRIAKICRTSGLTQDWSFYEPDDELVYNIHSGLVMWEASKFKRLLLNIYKERAGSIFWMNPENGAVFAPYHAGVDVRVPTAEQLHVLRHKFENWLPTNGHGFLYLS